MRLKLTFSLFTLLVHLIPLAQLSTVEQKAIDFSQALLSGDNQRAYAYFDKVTAAELTPAQLASILPQLETQLGNFESAEGVTFTKEDDLAVTYQPMQFKKGLLDLKLTFNEEEKIIGMFFVPHKVFDLDLVENDSFYEEEIWIESGKEIKLRGILTLPKKDEKVPVLILVHGSGPNDMDETIGPNQLFKDLAHQLAQKGIGVIRYEKRTKAYAGRPQLDVKSLTLYEETIEDAISAVNLARKNTRIDKKNIFVLGHSLGGMSAPRIAKTSKHTKGIIILAGNARPMEDLVSEQYAYLFNEDGKIDTTEQKFLDDYEKQLINLEKLRQTGAVPEGPLPLGLSAAYWKYLMNYDQVSEAQSLNNPILVLQGERDYQVTMKDFKLWKKALDNHNDVTFKSYEKLNHIMREGSGNSYPSEYEIKSDLPTYLVDDIATWILNRK